MKNQEQCGSCWAFSATEQIESDVMRELNKTYILSVQQINSCTPTCGCELGGFTEAAYKYVKNAGGIEQDSDYPYTSHLGKTGDCLADSSTIEAKGVVSIGGYTAVKSKFYYW